MIFVKIKEISDYIQSKTEIRPNIGVILGSGLGVFTNQLENKTEIPYEDIPNFHSTTVAGHDGKLVLGEIAGVSVAAFKGRFHAYEGHGQNDVTLPIRTLKLLGAKTVVLTNAAGGINTNFSPGTLVSIKDHINLTGRSPLIGPNDERFGPRFPDMTYAYDPEIRKVINQCAKDLSIELKEGVYAGVLGPAYETPAEINMLRTLGADMVGMSTVAEAIAANHTQMKVAGISCITNMAAGMLKEKLDHKDVKDVANKAIDKFSKLLCLSIEKIGNK